MSNAVPDPVVESAAGPPQQIRAARCIDCQHATSGMRKLVFYLRCLVEQKPEVVWTDEELEGERSCSGFQEMGVPARPKKRGPYARTRLG